MSIGMLCSCEKVSGNTIEDSGARLYWYTTLWLTGCTACTSSQWKPFAFQSGALCTGGT